MGLMTRVRVHCGRSDRCGDGGGGGPSAVSGDTSQSGEGEPGLLWERAMKGQSELYN